MNHPWKLDLEASIHLTGGGADTKSRAAHCKTKDPKLQPTTQHAKTKPPNPKSQILNKRVLRVMDSTYIAFGLRRVQFAPQPILC